MARSAKKTPRRSRAKHSRQRVRPLAWLRRWLLRILGGVVVLTFLVLSFFAFVDPPTTPYMLSESRRIGPLERDWVPLEEIAPVMARAAVAAEDANFCRHWGLDLTAIRAAMASGGARGGSTISQQVVKNVFLWHGRSYIRKSLEAVLTPAMEAVWSKRRILEVYLNVAEFDEGVFGVEAAAQHYFGISAAALSPAEAGLLAAMLPAPKSRSATNPTAAVSRRAAEITDGAAYLARTGGATCFEAQAG